MTNSLTSLESRVTQLEERNARVEADKSFETSTIRKGAIFLLTFVTFTIYHIVNDSKNPLASALIPAVAYLLSTPTLKFLQHILHK